MPDRRDLAINWFNDNQVNQVNNLKELLSIPSISTDSSHKSELEKAAIWIAEYLNRIGIKSTKIFATKQNPIVFGEYKSAGEKKPTVLIYGHYDVQPPDPLDQWQSDPFLPIEKNGKLYARGASDMKGQLMVSLSAIDSIMQTGDLPINLKFLIEGEEEIGSPSIEQFLKGKSELLASDFAFNLDAGMIAADIPTIVYGLRGLAYFEIFVYGPEHDLHSGTFGGIVYNPAQALCEVLAKMKDGDGRILLPGYYNDVRSLSAEERQELSRLPMDDQYYLNQTGVNKLWGEKGYSAVERVGVRPTLDIHGINTGYIGEGPKTVIPSFAMVKLSTRLVPDQNPDRVHEQLLSFLIKTMPEYVRWELKRLTSDFPCIIDREFPPTQKFSQALEKEWNKKAVFKREGGSIPIVSHMKNILGIDTVLSGFGLPDDRIHSPNEHINLKVWMMGVETVIHFLFNLAGIN